MLLKDVLLPAITGSSCMYSNTQTRNPSPIATNLAINRDVGGMYISIGSIHHSGVGKCPNVSHHPRLVKGYFISKKYGCFGDVFHKSPKYWDINPNPLIIGLVGKSENESTGNHAFYTIIYWGRGVPVTFPVNPMHSPSASCHGGIKPIKQAILNATGT